MNPNGGSRARIAWGVILFLIAIAALNMVTGHNFRNSLSSSGPGSGLSRGLEFISEGTRRRQVGFMISGVLGLFGLWRFRAQPIRFNPVVVWPVSLFMAWCTMSLVWAVEPMLTLRRLVVFWLLVLAVAGVVRATPREFLPYFVGITALVYLLLGFGAELVLGTFTPLRLGYRFSGTLHPSNQGINCAYLGLFGVWLASGQLERRWRLVGWLLVGLALSFLVLSKARTPFAGFFGVAAILVVLRLKPDRRALIVAAVFNLLLFLVILIMNGLVQPPVEALMLGRGSGDVTTLNSRRPLWMLLIDYLEQRPILGYGYAGFMTAEHAFQIGMILEFGIAGAHSLYLEIMLGIGAVGLVLLLVVLTSAIWSCIRQSRYSAPDSFFASVLLFELLIGWLDSSMVFPSWRLLPLVILGAACLLPELPRSAPGAAFPRGFRN
jgi:O-antigen ligase